MKKNVITSFLWDLSGKIGVQGVSFLIGIILARLLSPIEYGLIGMSMVFIGFSGIFTNFGLSSALIQRKEPNEGHYSSSFYFNIVIALLFTVIFILIAPYIADFFEEPKITNIIRALSINVLFSSFNIVHTAILNREMNFKIIAKARIISTLISGLIGITMAFLSFGVWSLVLQTIIGTLIYSITLWYSSNWRPRWIFRINSLKELWSFGFHLFLNNLLNILYNNLSTIIIAKIFNPVILGLYTRAESLNRFVIKYTSDSVNSVIYPALTQLQDNKQNIVNLGSSAQKLISFMAFGLLGLLYITSEPLIIVLLGQKWTGVIPIYKLLCFSGFYIPISAVTTNMFKAIGKSKDFLVEDVFKKIFGLIAMGIGFMYGLNGFLYGLIFSAIVSVLLDMLYVQKNLKYSLFLQLKSILLYPIIVSVLILFFKYANISLNNNIFEIVLLVILYIGLYYVCNKIFKTSGLRIFQKQVQRIIELKFK